jgi:hypothetical protein
LLVFSSVATSSEDPDGLKTRAPLFVSGKMPILMGVEESDSHNLPEASQSYTATDFEQAFQKYFSRP